MPCRVYRTVAPLRRPGVRMRRGAALRLPPGRSGNPLGLRATESARQVDDKADQEDKAKPSSTDSGASKVKAAASEQKKKHDKQDY